MKRMKYLLFGFMLYLQAATAQHPFKYDNTVYKAVYLTEAFRLMDSMQNFLLLDVRSPGEYDDTARATVLNLGRIKGSVNISIDSVPSHMAELKKHINQPVFVYCSHSQRSRRVSKLLAENGFKNVYNINGGMTLVNELDDTGFPYKNKVLITNLAYKNIASTDALHLIENNPDLVIIDIRTKEEFESKDSLEQNNIGHLKNAINIPQAEFSKKITDYKIAKNSPILLCDLHGYNSMDVVDILRANGFTRIYNLFEGLEAFICDHRLNRVLVNQLFSDPPAYQMVDPGSSIDLLTQRSDLVIIDTRPAEEFENKAAMSHLNLGHIKGAIHISSPDSVKIFVGQKDKSTAFLIYGSGSDMGAIVSRELVKEGYQNVNFLCQGLYHFVWSTANIEDCKAGKEFLTDHEGLY